MDFLIADTFTGSLTRLTADEQKSVKTSAFDLQLNPAHPGLSCHKLDKAIDKNFCSIRVGSDTRLIVHIPKCEGISCWFVDTDYNEESFFVRYGYFLGASDTSATFDEPSLSESR